MVLEQRDMKKEFKGKCSRTEKKILKLLLQLIWAGKDLERDGKHTST